MQEPGNVDAIELQESVDLLKGCQPPVRVASRPGEPPIARHFLEGYLRLLCIAAEGRGAPHPDSP